MCVRACLYVCVPTRMCVWRERDRDRDKDRARERERAREADRQRQTGRESMKDREEENRCYLSAEGEEPVDIDVLGFSRPITHPRQCVRRWAAAAATADAASVVVIGGGAAWADDDQPLQLDLMPRERGHLRHHHNSTLIKDVSFAGHTERD